MKNNALKSLFKESQLSYTQFAKIIGFCASHTYNLIKDQKQFESMSIKSLRKLAKNLKCKPADLI